MKTTGGILKIVGLPILAAVLALIMTAMPAAGATTPGIPGYHANSDATNIFELDGNATYAGSGKSDDWNNILNTGGATHGDFGIVARSRCIGTSCDSAWPGVLVDPYGTSIFVQGSKDLSDITSWSCRDQAAPDKDELSNAYAVAYDYNGDLVVYLGTDRYSNSGTATMGFWLLQAAIAQPNCLPGGDGKFENDAGTAVKHAVGDLLVVADFTNGGAIGTVRLFEWVGSGGSDGTLNKLFEAVPGTSTYDPNIDCTNSGNGAGDICGTINQVAVTSPWTYIPKGASGDSDFIKFGFMEVGVNLSRVFRNLGSDVPCFSTFVAETRSSAEPNASQKDFVLGSFNVCAINVSKKCSNNTPNLTANPVTFTYDVGGCFDNTGFGSVHNFNLSDSPTAFDTNTLKFYGPFSKTVITDLMCANLGALKTAVSGLTPISTSSTLAPGDRVVWLANFTSTSNGGTDTVTGTAQGSGGATISDVTAQATCPSATFNPHIKVTKNCTATLEDTGSQLVAKVTISGYVCNTGDVPLSSVTVNDSTTGGNPGDIPTPILSVTSLQANPTPGASADCSSTAGSGKWWKSYLYKYTPNTIPTTPQGVAQRYVFKDDVTASGTPPTGTGTAQTDTAHAECALCPGCNDLVNPSTGTCP